MKMLTVLRAPQAGKVVAVYAQLGDAVAAGAVLVQLAGEGG
jgi:biotin carboxyl carrier protein